MDFFSGVGIFLLVCWLDTVACCLSSWGTLVSSTTWIDPDEDFSDQLDEEEEEDDFKEEGQGSPKDKDEDVVKSEGGQSQG